MNRQVKGHKDYYPLLLAVMVMLMMYISVFEVLLLLCLCLGSGPGFARSVLVHVCVYLCM